MTYDEITVLMDKKKIAAEKAVAHTSRVMAVLGRASAIDMTPEEKKTWIVSVVNPLQRKHGGASASLLFWTDRKQVEAWLHFKETGSLLEAEAI